MVYCGILYMLIMQIKHMNAGHFKACAYLLLGPKTGIFLNLIFLVNAGGRKGFLPSTDLLKLLLIWHCRCT